MTCVNVILVVRLLLGKNDFVLCVSSAKVFSHH